MHERPRIPLRRLRTALASTAILVASLVLTGCAAAHSPEPAPEPAPAPTPSLTQEQQDDQAFQDLFSRFVGIDLSSETEGDLTPLLTGSALQGELDSLKYSADNHQKVIGKVTSRGFRVTDRGSDAQGSEYMTAQACLDISGTRTVDEQGKDVTPQRDAAVALQMKAVKIADGSWRISDSVRNEDTRACE
ncbi:hypothetical protein [Clavibacter nebraskensis]|uniref:Secreted protein n=2 Tax=Clavibacter nebraskensis TaxID=31963 RepID=A0A399QNN9_9MICO|nr:hypothetical protein [Clavibacter nebraskensis]KXU21043.1 hypothetical protein VV38_05820 [Clavibacter nebraskensis]OAH22325.1 hypothetical protein A3Q38_02745 [Clavibacter nebraskensis]QGV68073.1 hypothetical protein EGX36_06155 [Clavibacter nebraskensis]QGV69237.1 hypothetical protein EGX37_06145 [Clavibacter nebraskensis]QGV72027.1 hypothetical protein EGX35_06145 [Clavibacter nebraskensis]